MELMELMEWSERFKLGYARIDSDHQKLIALINQLTEAMTKRAGKDVCGTVLNELINYFKTHFAMEEQLMANFNYADAVSHKAEHAMFVDEVLKMKAKLEANSFMLPVSLLKFLRDWLSNHILVTDKALVAGLPPQ